MKIKKQPVVAKPKKDFKNVYFGRESGTREVGKCAFSFIKEEEAKLGRVWKTAVHKDK